MLDLTKPQVLASLLARHGISAKKSLGQHFLCDPSVVRAIAEAAHGARSILEIGPGPGVLTGPLSEQFEQVIAVELDPRMRPLLAESAPRALVQTGDALKEDWNDLLASMPKPRAIVSNMPYYITGPLLDRIESAMGSILCAVLMMQHEVGERISAPAGKSSRGALSVCLQAKFSVEHICHVGPGCFEPPPKVQSVVLRLTPRKDSCKLGENFRRFVQIGFKQPRKTLMNNLSSVLEKSTIERLMLDAGLEAGARAHMLTEEQWIALARGAGYGG